MKPTRAWQGHSTRPINIFSHLGTPFCKITRRYPCSRAGNMDSKTAVRRNGDRHLETETPDKRFSKLLAVRLITDRKLGRQ